MRFRSAVLLACLVAIGTRSLNAQGRGAATDSTRLQGVWVMISGSADGVAMPPDMAKTMKRVADGPYVTVTMSGNLYFKAHFVLKPDASPKEIDYHMTDGFPKGSTQLGVYRISGDTAWFSFAAPGAARATAFKSVAGDKWTVSAWVRAKP